MPAKRRWLIDRSQRTQRELVKAFLHAWAPWFAFRSPVPLSFNLMTSFILQARFEFVGQNSASKKPVQCLAALLGAADPYPGWSMPQIDPRAVEKTFLNVLF
jgi:hypothetical protein